jgi:hypothetical protein
MATRDNAPPPSDWRPFARHCGELCWDKACPVCGEYVVPANVTLGSE